MKKSIKWLLCASLALGSAFTVACADTHEHTYADTYSSDAVGHWKAATCDHTDLKSEMNFHDGMDDGVCDTCNYDAHEGAGHTFASDWSKDADGHWKAATCGHSVKSEEGAHVDENNDGECDTCAYIDHEHTYASDWTNDEYEHWHAANCGCTVDHQDVEAHEDANQDGFCDTCNYDEHQGAGHQYKTEWSKDGMYHWKEATCGHAVVGEKAKHVSEDGDAFCDDCGISAYEMIIQIVTSDEVKNGIVSGMALSSDGAIYYEFGDDYYHKVDATYNWEYWYTTVDDNVIALVDRGSGLNKNYVDADAGKKVLNGEEIYLYVGDACYGVEDAIAYYWAMGNSSSAYNMTTTFDGSEFSFSFDYYEYGLYKITVSFVLGEAGELYYAKDATFAVQEYEYDTYTKEYDDDYNVVGVTITGEPNEEYAKKLEFVSQRVAERTAKCPFDVESMFATSFDLDMYKLTYEDWMWNEASESTPFSTDITMEIGSGYKFYFTNVAPTTANLAIDTFKSTIDGEEDSYAMQINAYLQEGYFEILAQDTEAGVYEVVISTVKATMTLNITVVAPAVTSFEAGTVVESQYGNSFEAVTTMNTFTGMNVKFYSKVNENANKAYTAVVTGENAANATLTLGDEDYFGIPYTFNATQAGTYTVVLTSAESTAENAITATLTIVVSNPPSVADILNGSYEGVDPWYGGVNVTFTPAEADATNGTAVIYVLNVDGVATATYNVKYVYDDGIVLTNTDDTAFEDVIIEMNNYKLSATFMVESYWGPEPCTVDMAEADPYTAPSATEMVAGQYRYEYYADPNDWNPSSITDIYLNEDGTGSYGRFHLDENYDLVYDAEATFTFTAVDNGDGTYTVTISNVEGTTELAAGNWTVGTVEGEMYGQPIEYVAITGVMVNGTATEFPIY